MSSTSLWKPVEPDLETVFEQFERPLDELAAGNIPAIEGE